MIRVRIISESAVTRAGLAALLAQDGRFLVLDSPAADSDDVDVVVLVGEESDVVTMPQAEGGPAPVALLDDFTTAAAARLLRHGARAVLPSDASADQIEAAVAAVAVGLVSVPPAVWPQSSAYTENGTPQPLTGRETEILNLIAGGSGNRKIAAQLGISEHTVKSHVESIFEKLHVSTRAEAVARGIQQGIVFI